MRGVQGVRNGRLVQIWASLRQSVEPSVRSGRATGTDTGKSSAERGTECGVRVRASDSARNDGAVVCFRPRIMSPSNRPDFYVVTSHRRSNHVNSPATRPMISHRLSPCFDFGVTDASEVLVWNRKALGGTRCILLEVSALGARDRLSTSHYQRRSPCPSQSPYEP